MTALSSNIKNGQQLNVLAGPVAINAGDLVSIGGAGNEAWSAACIDYATIASSGILAPQTEIVAAAMPGGARQPIARDRLGNLYIIGTNSSGNLVVYKYNPLGTLISSANLDGTATSVNSPALFQLQSGAYACVYARATGALYFVIFDSSLSILSGPISIGAERANGNVVYHAACALSGGGFAVVYQTSAASAINLVTYSNLGVAVLAATAIQALTGAGAQQFLRIGQLSNGNLVCAYRGAMLAGGTAGTSFTIVTTGGANVAGPTNFDNTATLGFLDLSILTGFFALAEANGANLECGVFNNAGAQQSSTFSISDTLNSLTYPQVKLLNDNTQFYLVWFSSAANGLNVLVMPSTGVSGTSASGLGAGTLNASTFALDAEVINGMIVALAASSATAGQFWMSVGLPDGSLGIGAPYIRTAPTGFGSAAGTTGSYWPRVLCGGAGLYIGANQPNGQPSNSRVAGDWTAIFVYDQQNTGAQFFGVQKVESSAIVGVAVKAVSAGSPGSPIPVNPGAGEYQINPISGSSGLAFNHLVGAPAGTAGILYTAGIGMAGVSQVVASAVQTASLPTGSVVGYAGAAAPTGWLLAYGQAVSRTSFANLFTAIGTTFGNGDGATTFNLPDLRGRFVAYADAMGGTPANRLGSGATGGITGSATVGATGGEQEHTQTQAELFPHTHTYSAAASAATSPNQGGGASAQPGSITGSTGGGAPANITPPVIVLNGIIKT